MKTLFAIVSVLFFAVNVSAQHTNHNAQKTKITQKTAVAATDSFNVNGVCEMCKKRIETAAKTVPGVKTASWNISTHNLIIQRNPDVKVVDVQKAVAAVGHDTKFFKAPDAVYNKLHSCCKYR